MLSSKRILVAPLNWGLGHATRCMPIIDLLLEKGVEVLLATDGRSYELLKNEYPNLRLLKTPSYNITYKSGNMILNIAPQLPKILRAINKEKKWLEEAITKYKIDAVISDNRYGMCSKQIPSIFLTHQVNIKLNIGLAGLANWNSKRLIRQFDECWIPDFKDTPNLSGELSHPAILPNVRYIGMLSRLKKQPMRLLYHLAVILSGPEPQRTLLEEKIKAQLSNTTKKVILVRGITEQADEENLGNLTIKNFLTANELSNVFASTKLVLARSGYSTIMDLVKLGKRAILIPTPGQTEQEYLAKRFHEKQQFYCQQQNNFELLPAIEQAERFTGFPLEEQPELLEAAVNHLLAKINHEIPQWVKQ